MLVNTTFLVRETILNQCDTPNFCPIFVKQYILIITSVPTLPVELIVID